eukprot:5156774-Pleurochrysis_carterae.AAC.4
MSVIVYNRERVLTVYNALVLESHVGALHDAEPQPPWRRPVQRVLMRVGPSADKLRVVCKESFLEHCPYSLASLKRRMHEKRIGVEPGKLSL